MAVVAVDCDRTLRSPRLTFAERIQPIKDQSPISTHAAGYLGDARGPAEIPNQQTIPYRAVHSEPASKSSILATSPSLDRGDSINEKGRKTINARQKRANNETVRNSARLPSRDERTPSLTLLSTPMSSSNGASIASRRPVRLLIASLGNPSPYQDTRHSAGHILLKSLRSYLSLPQFTKSKVYGGQVSRGADVDKPQWTLFQSSSYMNTSGLSILKAYREFVKEQKASCEESIDGLVILHDEMELEPSAVKLRRGPTSAKGHNGIKSVQQSLQSAGLLDGLVQRTSTLGLVSPGDRFIKLAIGIGRPASKTRDPNDISAYVLAQLTTSEKNGIDQVSGKVVAMLETEMARLSSSQ